MLLSARSRRSGSKVTNYKDFATKGWSGVETFNSQKIVDIEGHRGGSVMGEPTPRLGGEMAAVVSAVDSVSDSEIDNILQSTEDLDALFEQEKREMEREAKRAKAAEIVMMRNARAARRSSHHSGTDPSHPTGASQPVDAKVAALISQFSQKPISETSHGSDSSSDESVCSSQSRREKRGKALNKASGLHDTNRTYVKKKQKFPHAALQPEFLARSKAPTFDELNLQLFVAGELEIVLNGGISPDEVLARLRLLKNAAYKADYIDFGTIRDTHCAILRKIENGYATWASDFSPVERQIIESRDRRDRKSKLDKDVGKGEKRSEKKWYCRFFNKRGV